MFAYFLVGRNCNYDGCAGHSHGRCFEDAGILISLKRAFFSSKCGHFGLSIPERFKKVLEQLHGRSEQGFDGKSVGGMKLHRAAPLSYGRRIG